LLAQERGGRDTPGASSAGTASISSRGIAATSSTPAPSVSASVSRDSYGGQGSYAGSVGGAALAPAPRLHGTSFVSASSYYDSLNFHYWVYNHFYLDRYYFSRFYRNTEPLITPKLAQLTLRQPLVVSSHMLTAIDELEKLILDAQAGKPVSKQQIASKTEEIRDYAKQLRQSESLTYFDRRKEKDLLKGSQPEELGLEAVAQLREMALDLNRQIRNLYEQSSTSTVSVDSLAAPSFSSLSKGIEKLSKVISSSARKLS